jgi:hypothetical protein
VFLKILNAIVRLTWAKDKGYNKLEVSGNLKQEMDLFHE